MPEASPWKYAREQLVTYAIHNIERLVEKGKPPVPLPWAHQPWRVVEQHQEIKRDGTVWLKYRIEPGTLSGEWMTDRAVLCWEHELAPYEKAPKSDDAS